MIFKQETIKSWFSGINSSINNEVIKPFQNAEQVIWKYNQAIEHNSLTQNGWNRILSQSDDSLKMYLASIKGTTASMTGYTTSLQGNITGFKKVSSAITQYNSISSTEAENQTIFANAVSATNTKLGTYLAGLNGAKASLSGYVLSLVGATAKTIALQFATIALNSAITMGASLIISGIVSAISSWVHKTENMISASEDALNTIKSLNDELKKNQKTISDTAKRFAELSQGVNQLTGENISLSSKDYKEFLNISNQLAEMFPTLTRNYNDNGDAIVQLSGDADTIVGSLHNLIEAQRELTNRQIAEELPTIFDGLSAKSNAYKEQLLDLESRKDALVKSLGDVQSDDFTNNFMNEFSNKWIEIAGDNLEVISQIRDDYIKILTDADIDFEELTPDYEVKNGVEVPVGFTIKINSSDEDIENAKLTIDGKIEVLAKQYETDIQKLNGEINAINEKNKANWNNLSNSIFAWLSTDDSFKVMNDDMQATVQSIVNNFDWSSLDFSSWKDAEQYIQENILSLFNTTEGKKILADIQVMLGVKTQFNNGDISVNDYQNKVQELLANMDGLPDETKKSIMWLFGVNFEEDGTTTFDTDILINNVKEKLQDDFDNKVGKLTLEELHIAAEQVEVPEGTLLSWDELISKIKEIQNSTSDNEAPTLSQTIDQLNTQLKPTFDSLKSAYQSIFTSDGFNPNAVDIPMLDSIKSSIEEINKLEDVDITIDMDAFGTLATTLADINTTKDQARQAFKDFATSIFYATNATDGITEETKELVEQLLESLGIVNATEVAEYALAEAKAKDILATYDVINAKEEEYAAILAESTATGIVRQQLYKLMAAEIAFGNNDLSVEDKIQKLKELAEQYGDTAGAALASAIANDLASGHTDADTALSDLLAQINEGLVRADIDFSGLDRSAAKAGSSAGKSYSDALKDELSRLNSVISYVGTILDDQIGLFNDQKDAAVEALEAEKQAAEEALEAEKALIQEQIDAKQAEIDKIEEASRARKDEIDLQQKQYNLERLQNQKTILQYSEGKGMHYAADTKEIREAREAVTEAKENLRIAGIEKEISGLNETLDSLDRKIEASNEYYDSLIEETEKYWDSLIRGLEDYKSRWQELSGIEEQAKMEAALRNLGIATDDILGMSESAFQSFKDNYLGILREMYSGNDDILYILQEIGGISAGTLRPLAGDINHIADSIRNVSGSISGGAGTSPGGRTGDGSGQSPDSTGQSPGSSLTGSIETLGETTEETLGEPDGDGVTGKFSELGQTISESESHVAGIIGNMEDLNGMTAECTITIHIETIGDIPDYASGTGIADTVSSIGSSVGGGVTSKGKGTAHTGTKIRGSAKVTGSWDIREAGRTLVGELGQELWVHAKDGAFETVGDSGAEFIRTEKGDLIFNHLQTRELLSKGHLTGRGNPSAASTARTAGNIPVSGSPADSPATGHNPADAGELTSRGFPADGNLPAAGGSHKAGEDIIITGDGTVLLPYDPDKDPTPFGDAFRKWHAHMAKLNEQEAEDFLKLDTASERNRQMLETINQISNTSIITQNNRPSINVGDINISCPGVTSQAVMREVKTALNREFSGFYNYADQWIRK